MSFPRNLLGGIGDTSQEAVTSPIKPKLNKGHKENLDNQRGEKSKITNKDPKGIQEDPKKYPQMSKVL